LTDVTQVILKNRFSWRHTRRHQAVVFEGGDIFPVLAERRRQLAGTMSGGEQQMLAVGRGLMLKPRLLMLDEPSLGLAPVTTDVTFQKIQEIHGMGTEILLVEQNVSRALTLVQRAYVLKSGKVIMHGTSAELANNKQVQAAYLGSNANALPSNPDQFKSKFRWAIPVYYRRVVVAPERNHCHRPIRLGHWRAVSGELMRRHSKGYSASTKCDDQLFALRYGRPHNSDFVNLIPPRILARILLGRKTALVRGT
jgi:ABC transporter/Branched-chain amino acid ATP-binding cassette transporter